MQAYFRIVAFLFCLFFTQISIAQTHASEPDVTLESPYNTIYVHLYYLQPDSYQPELAAQTIYPGQDSITAQKRAIQLKQILDGRGLFIHLNLLPREADYIDSLSQKAFYTPFPEELPQVYLEKVGSKWYYAQSTVSQIQALHKEVYPLGSDLLVNALQKMGQNKVLGLAIWQYIGIAILLILLLLLHLLLSRIINPLVQRITRSKISPNLVSENLIWSLARLLSTFVLVRLLMIFVPSLHLPVSTASFVFLSIRVVSSVLVAFILLRIVDIIMLYADRITMQTESKMDEQLLPIMKRGLQVIIIIAMIIQILSLLDVNVTALIAGVSIGGLALALAAQDTVKNLIGSAMIFIDQPFQIGDWIEEGGVAGTVVEVGFRTTRIRTTDSSIVSVPNGTIANQSVTNRGLRVFRLFQTTIGVTYDTPPILIEKYVEGLRKIVLSHPHTLKEGYYIHLNNLGDSAIQILFRVSLRVGDYGNELKVKEELLLAIIRLAEEMGVRFAFPSSTLYIEEFPEKKNGLAPYETDEDKLDDHMNAWIEKWRVDMEKQV